MHEPELVLDARAHLAEGPVWDGTRDWLWWVDLPAGAIHRYEPATGVDAAIHVGQPVGAVDRTVDGLLIGALRDGFATIAPDTGALTWLAHVERDLPTMRMNDGKVDPQGRFWAGTMDMDARPERGTLYRLDAVRGVAPITDGLTIPNGIDWSPDGRTMYLADSGGDGSMHSTTIRARACRPADGG